MPTQGEKKKLDKWAVRKALRQDARDFTLFLGGMGGIAHETLIAPSPREALLLLFGAMIGIIPFLRLDDAIEKLRRESNEKPEPENE